jgi:hypothetical protein
MKLHLILLGLLVSTAAQAGDGFEAVRCGGDVRSALLGKKVSDEPVMQIEKRHAVLGLKDLGGDEITDDLNSTSWRICDKEYVMTTGRDDIVRDVLAFPEHSKAAPEFSAVECEAKGKKISGSIIGVLDADRARVKAAWKIDDRSGKFSALATTGLACPKHSIITVDGGQ